MWEALGLFSAQVTTGGAEIAAPYDFGFQLRHYVIAPEVREGQKLVDHRKLPDGFKDRIQQAPKNSHRF